MLKHPTREKLLTLKLHGMLKALEEQAASADSGDLSFEERLGLLVDREITERENRRLTTNLRQARLSTQACLANIDYRSSRGLDKSLIRSLGECHWIKEHLNILITGPTGAGKSFIAEALAHQGCLNGCRALKVRLPRFFEELSIAQGDGRLNKILNSIKRVHVLILDDYGFNVLSQQERKFFLEILEDRYETYPTIVTSQLPVGHWHEMIGNATFADAILDRLVHGAYQINLKGESMRKMKAKEKS
jgi:DNA replication protein DnaC